MSVAGNVRFACEGCGKTYPWKPELAGKRAKCKCGTVMDVPASAPEPEAAQEPSFDDLYALADQANTQAAAPAPASAPACPSCQNPWPPGAVFCTSCGYDLNTGAIRKPPAAGKPKTPKAGKSRAPAAGAAGAGLYGSSRRGADAEASAVSSQIMDLYVPIGLLAFGSGISIWRIMGSGEMSIIAATLFFAVWTAFEAVLVFLGCLIGIKWLGISLGDPLKALLKIGAVIVGPFGAAFALSWITGTWVVGFLVAPILYYALLSVFFDMDLGEVLLLSGVVYVLQYAGRLLLLLTLLRVLFGEVPPVVAQIAGMALFGAGSSMEDKIDPTVVQRKAVDDDKLTDDMIKEDRFTMDVKAFFINPNNNVAGMTRDEATAFFDDLFARGAARVRVSDVSGFADRKMAAYTAQVLIIDLPSEPSARVSLFDKYNQFQVPRGYKAAKDIGQKYLRFWTLSKVEQKKLQADDKADDEADDDEDL